jgi:serine/threonine protein kinase
VFTICKAPEVLGNEPTYNLKADVYTFGILMWEVLSLKKPYAFTRSMAALVDHVGKLPVLVVLAPSHCFLTLACDVVSH